MKLKHYKLYEHCNKTRKISNHINESCSPKSKEAIKLLIEKTRGLIQNIDEYYEITRNIINDCGYDLNKDGLIDAVINDEESHEMDNGLNMAKISAGYFMENLEGALKLVESSNLKNSHRKKVNEEYEDDADLVMTKRKLKAKEEHKKLLSFLVRNGIDANLHEDRLTGWTSVAISNFDETYSDAIRLCSEYADAKGYKLSDDRGFSTTYIKMTVF